MDTTKNDAKRNEFARKYISYITSEFINSLNMKKFPEEEKLINKIDSNLLPIFSLTNTIINIFQIIKYIKITQEEMEILITKIVNIFFEEIEKDPLIRNELISDNKLIFDEKITNLLIDLFKKVIKDGEINYEKIKQFFKELEKELNYNGAEIVANNIINKLMEIKFENKELQDKILMRRIIKSLNENMENIKNNLGFLKNLVLAKYENNLDSKLRILMIVIMEKGATLEELELKNLNQIKESLVNLMIELEKQF